MSLVQMSSVEEATHALVHLHGYGFEGSVLRVSFSKSKIKEQ
jgi:RNA recognition motif-containing protein